MKMLICLIAIAGALLPRCAFGVQEVFVPANDVSFTISTDRSRYPAGNSIVVRYEIKNISNRALFVPKGQWGTCSVGPHVWAWFEDSGGRHFRGGWAGSCAGEPKTVTERMQREAVLLRPKEHMEGKLVMEDPKVFALKPGEYRIEAVLLGWKEDDFNQKQRLELAKMGHPFLRGEVPTSIRLALADWH